nr:hypothetical protein [Actinocorallia populi]
MDLPVLYFHALRHVGNTLAASTRASLKELMSRIGHASTRAAPIYQHATTERDKAIAQTLGSAFKAAQGGNGKDTKAIGHRRPRRAGEMRRSQVGIMILT